MIQSNDSIVHFRGVIFWSILLIIQSNNQRIILFGPSKYFIMIRHYHPLLNRFDWVESIGLTFWRTLF